MVHRCCFAQKVLTGTMEASPATDLHNDAGLDVVVGVIWPVTATDATTVTASDRDRSFRGCLARAAFAFLDQTHKPTASAGYDS